MLELAVGRGTGEDVRVFVLFSVPTNEDALSVIYTGRKDIKLR